MKLPFFHFQFKKDRGEIATLLTLISVGLMIVGAFAGSKLAERSTEQRTQARGFGQLQTQALSGCQIVDTDQGPGCWCSNGGWQGHCFEGKKRGEPQSQLCKDNCSNKNGSTPDQNITPAPTGAGDQTGSPTGADCNLNSSSLSPAVGDKCGNCVVFKSGDLEANGLRKTFDNWGFSACNNNQIISYWCNGAVSEEGKNTCQARLGECRATAADCTGAAGADKYPLPGETAPTAPAGGGNEDNPDDPVGNPPVGIDPIESLPPETDATAYPNGFYVIKGKITNIPVPTSQAITTPNIRYSKVQYSGGNVISIVDNSETKFGSPLEKSYDPVNGNTIYSFGDKTDNYIILPIQYPIASVADTKAEINFKNDSKIIFGYQTNTLSICFPFGKYGGKPNAAGATITPRPTPAVTDVYKQIVQECDKKGKISDASFDYANYTSPTGIPASTPDASTFYPSINFALIDDSAPARSYKQYELRDITAKLVLGTSNFTLFSSQNYLPEGQPTSFTANVTMKISEAAERELKVSFIGAVWDITDANPINHSNLFSCVLDSTDERTKIKVPANTSLSAPIAYYGLELVYNSGADLTPVKCKLGSEYQIYHQSVIGSSNEAFHLAMTRWTNGEIGVLQMSAFISQLTRAPGLQITTCNPENGGCNF